MKLSKKISLTCMALLGLSSCSQEPKALMLDAAQAYLSSVEPSVQYGDKSDISLSTEDEQLFLKYSPEFVVEDNNFAFNKIGEPRLKSDKSKKIAAYVDPSSPKIYAQKTQFSTEKGTYTNLIYRVHFKEVPFSLMPFNIGAGKNVGLIISVTLDESEKPILFTTVHSCGCYISIIPTNFLPKDSFPTDWKNEPVYRYGEKHSAILEYPEPFSSEYHPVIYLRSQTHRVTDIIVEKLDEIQSKYHSNQMPLVAITELDHIKIDGKSEECSFFYNGLNKGFVRSDLKPFEFLFLSIIAMDINIGVDKKYAPHTELRSRFYTSINPLNRKKSDMWDYERFLKFWGWNL